MARKKTHRSTRLILFALKGGITTEGRLYFGQLSAHSTLYCEHVNKLYHVVDFLHISPVKIVNLFQS